MPSFRRTTRRRNALLPRGTGPAAFVAAGALALLFMLRMAAPGALVALISPLLSAGTGLTNAAGGLASTFGSPQKLARERDSAVRERDALAAQNAILAAKVADLTKLVGARTEPAHAILAGVLARPPVSPYDALLLDQGSDAGVVPGALVSGPGGVPVGTIESVAKGSSRAVLFSAPGRETAGWVGESRAPLTLAGQGAGAFGTEVPHETAVAVGDEVFVAGPGALPIGVVMRVDSNPSSPDTALRIRPAVNPFSLTWVTIAR
jgi:cell shape-determining protein MreC